MGRVSKQEIVLWIAGSVIALFLIGHLNLYVERNRFSTFGGDDLRFRVEALEKRAQASEDRIRELERR